MSIRDEISRFGSYEADRAVLGVYTRSGQAVAFPHDWSDDHQLLRALACRAWCLACAVRHMYAQDSPVS